MVTVTSYTGKTNSSIFEFSVKDYQKISDTQGNFTGTLDDGTSFGISLANIGDFNAVGTTGDDGGSQRGAVWILFLNTDGTVGN